MRSTMTCARHFTILTFLLLLRICTSHDAEHAAPQQQLTIINVENDLEAQESNIEETQPVALQQVQFKDEEVSISPRISAEPSVVTEPSPVTVTMTSKQQKSFGNDGSAQTTVLPRPVTKARPRMSKPDAHLPMYYKIVKKVEYGGPKKVRKVQAIQRRQGQGNDHKVVLRPMMPYHIPHTVKFYIQPSHLKGPKGGKVYLPVMPKPGDKVPKWALGPNGALKQPAWAPAAAKPHSYVKFSAPVPKKNRRPQQAFVPGHYPQYPRYPLPPQVPHAPANSHYGHEAEQEAQYEAAPWSHGGARPAHRPPAAVPELPEWAQGDASFEIDADGFSPVALPHVYPARFPGGGPAGPPGYDPSIYAGFPQGNQAYAQMPVGPPGSNYAVEEQTFDVPPPRGPTRRPPGAPLPSVAGPPGPARTPGLSAAAQPQMITQSQLQSQYNQFGSQYQDFSGAQGAGPSADIDYSAYQPKPAQIAPAPEHPKRYPSLSAIQDFSPNYLRETQYSEEESEQPEAPWAYQPPQSDHAQWAQRIPDEHKPNLQASYAWKQRTQDGQVIQVQQNVQESRTEITKVKPASAHQFLNHAPQHHEVVKQQVASAMAEKEGEQSSQEAVREAPKPPQDEAQAAPQSSQKDGMISNGWTPIINS